MAIHIYLCKNCGKKDRYFDGEGNKCECGCENLERVYEDLPLKNRNKNKVDWYYGTQAVEGIEKDLNTRSKNATYDSLDDMIAEFGEKIAKEQGWIDIKTGKKVTREQFMLRGKARK
jgi:hypothetical protein